MPLFFESTNRLPHMRETSLLAKSLNCVQKNQLHASELSLDMVCRVPGGDSPHSAPSCEVPLDRRLHQDASSAAASLGRQGDRLLLTSRPKHHTPPRPGRVAWRAPGLSRVHLLSKKRRGQGTAKNWGVDTSDPVGNLWPGFKS